MIRRFMVGKRIMRLATSALVVGTTMLGFLTLTAGPAQAAVNLDPCGGRGTTLVWVYTGGRDGVFVLVEACN
jgi:uncharacterized membrane protein YdcZ (DUF606 family)